MKKQLILVIAIVVVGIAVFTACQQEIAGDSAVPQQTQPPVQGTQIESAAMNESTIQVSATETVKVAPDIAYIYLGIQTTGTDAGDAQQQNAQQAETFLAAMKAQGIADEDIETSNISMYQDYEDETKFIVDNTYKVTIRDINKVGEIIDAGVQAGANSTYSLRFDIADRDAVYIEALSKAMEAVGVKANEMAKAGGYTILRPQSIVENGSSGYYDAIPMTESAAMDAGAGNSTMPVMPSEIEVSAGVTGTYVLDIG